MRRPHHVARAIWVATPLLAATLSMVLGLGSAVQAQVPSADGDDPVTGRVYVRHDGGSDPGIRHCNNGQSQDDGEEPSSSAQDADTTDGGDRRQSNEPFSVIDPSDPDLVVAGWNDYCLTDLGAGWQGFGYSTDGGETWTDSMVPGYPQDTSAEGQASPLYGNHTDAGDPIGAFDNEGNLFVGGISFNRAGKTNGDVYVATYLTDPHPSGYPLDYERTRIVGRGTPSRTSRASSKTSRCSKSTVPAARTTAMCTCAGRASRVFGQNRLLQQVDRSGPHVLEAVRGHDPWPRVDPGLRHRHRRRRGRVPDVPDLRDSSANRRDAVGFARSTNGGQSFSDARLIRSFTAYDPLDPTRDCGDGAFECASEFVFHRVPLEPRVTADQMSDRTACSSPTTPSGPGASSRARRRTASAGSGLVGQSLVYVIASWNDGRTWSEPVAVDPAPRGHQFFPDLDALDGTLALVWQDNRTDDDYSVQFPIGNTLDGTATRSHPADGRESTTTSCTAARDVGDGHASFGTPRGCRAGSPVAVRDVRQP